MSFEEIIVERRGQVGWVYLNRPQSLNAITFKMMKELLAAFTELRDDRDVRVMVLSGKGRAFCAGADLTVSRDPFKVPDGTPDFMDSTVATDAVLQSFPKPVIAALNGVTCGGGLEMAMMSDIIFAADTARIGDAHINFAALPGGGSSVRLPRIIGVNRARYIMYTGDLFPAAEMERLGLVTKVVAADQLEADVQALAEKLCKKSPIALRRMKQLINDGLQMPLPQALSAEKLMVREQMRSYDSVEGRTAFREKREPQYKGY
jgi:enoyl-CoA hydratase/carnithine racemase